MGAIAAQVPKYWLPPSIDLKFVNVTRIVANACGRNALVFWRIVLPGHIVVGAGSVEPIVVTMAKLGNYVFLQFAKIFMNRPSKLDLTDN